MIKCPFFDFSPSVFKFLTIPPKEDPVISPAKKSTTRDKPLPLCFPIGIREPAKAKFGSSVGLPESKAQPKGIFSLFLAANLIFPLETTDVAMSRMIGGMPWGVGKQNLKD